MAGEMVATTRQDECSALRAQLATARRALALAEEQARQAEGRAREVQEKLTAIAALIQNPTLSWKQRCTRTATVLCLEAQRPGDDPAAPFVVDTTAIARYAGFIPPTDPTDPTATKRGCRSGRETLGSTLRELADLEAFETYQHIPEHDESGVITGSKIVLSTPLSAVDLLRKANYANGERKLQKPRGIHVTIDPVCPECHSDDTHLACRACGATIQRFVGTTGQRHKVTESGRAGETVEQDGENEELATQQENSSPHTNSSGHSIRNSIVAGISGTVPLAVDETGVPEELAALPQWVCWNGDKVPINPQTGAEASSTDPTTWAGHDDACIGQGLYGLSGVGFVFAPEDAYAGVDLDKCRDPETGTVEPWAEEIIGQLDSYTEVSPSGTGFHILLRGALPPGGRKNGVVEMYDHGRYFTVTGLHVAGTPTACKNRQADLAALHARVFPPPKPRPTLEAMSPPAGTEAEVLLRVRRARNAEKFERLWLGDWRGYATQSEADLALCDFLAFHGASAAQLDGLFRRSGLMRDKWDRRASSEGWTYGERTIAKALAQLRAP